jgi:hypothetical protein
VHGYVCKPPPGFPGGAQAPNSDNAIRGNTVNDNVRDGLRLNGPFVSRGVPYPGATDNP